MKVKSVKPYGSGPWPCVNKVCGHYKENVAGQADIQKKGKEIWAWFKCPHCGMKYRRTKPGQSLEKYLQKPCISDRGFLFEQRLKEYLSDQKMPIQYIAEILGVNVRIVVEYARKNGIDLSARYKERYSKRVNISWLSRAAGLNRDDIYGKLPYLPEMQKFIDEVCESQEEWIRRRYTEIAFEKKKAGGREFTYNDVKRKVQIRRGSYDRNQKLIEGLISELNGTLFMMD